MNYEEILFLRLHEATIQTLHYVLELKGILSKNSEEEIVFPRHLCRLMKDINTYVVIDTLIKINAIVEDSTPASTMYRCLLLIRQCKQDNIVMQLKITDLFNKLSTHGEAVHKTVTFSLSILKDIEEIEIQSNQIVRCAAKALKHFISIPV